jgi:hypothetical protein
VSNFQGDGRNQAEALPPDCVRRVQNHPSWFDLASVMSPHFGKLQAETTVSAVINDEPVRSGEYGGCPAIPCDIQVRAVNEFVNVIFSF